MDVEHQPAPGEGSTQLSLPYAVNIRTVRQAHAEIAAAFGQGLGVTLNLATHEDVDLALVQLILSARATALRTGIPFSLQPPAGGELRRVLERSGLLTDGDVAEARFWGVEATQ